MLTILSYLLFLLGAFLFSFVLWKKLRDDYTDQQIYGYTLFSVVTSLLALWAANSYASEFAFFITLAAFSSSSFLLLKYLEIKFFEFIDAVSIAFLYFFFFFKLAVLLQAIEFSGADLKNPLIQANLAEVLLTLVVAYIYKFFLKNYRQFSRIYPSGKIGFAGLATGSLFFLTQVPIQVYLHLKDPFGLVNLPFFHLTYQLSLAVISFLSFILFTFVVYLRSGRRG